MPVLENGAVRQITVEEAGISPDDPTLTDCVDCGDPVSEFDDGLPCDQCRRVCHVGCMVEVDLPVAYAGTFCHDCA